MKHPKQALNTDPGCLRLLWLPLLVLLLPNVQAGLLFYEGFAYPKGIELGETISNPPWENDKNQFTVGDSSLDFMGLRASTGRRLNVAFTSPSLDSVRTTPGAWESQSNGALYLSFLLRIESANGIYTNDSGTSVLTIGKASNGANLLGVNLLDREGTKLGVVKYPSASVQVSSAFFSSGTGTNLSADGSTTYLVVAKYEWVAGADNDIVTVWVNPASLGGSEDPTNKVSTCAGADGTQSAGRLTLSRGPHLNLDEIRVGQTWADVTPRRDPQHAASGQ